MDVDTFYMYLFLNWFTMLVSAAVSDNQKYVCGCRLYACINTRKLKGLDSREITSLPEIKSYLHGMSFQSLHAHHKIHLHTMKVFIFYP